MLAVGLDVAIMADGISISEYSSITAEYSLGLSASLRCAQ